MDLIVDTNYELQFENGDFKIGDPNQQHIEFILKSFYGQWRKDPLVGVGIESYINGSISTQTLKREIRTQLEADGFLVKEIKMTLVNGNLNIDIDARK